MSDPIDRVRLCRLLEVEEAFVVELERSEIIRSRPDGTYDARAVERTRISCSLSALGVNPAGLEVALDLLERWQDERRRVRDLLEQLRQDDTE